MNTDLGVMERKRLISLFQTITRPVPPARSGRSVAFLREYGWLLQYATVGVRTGSSVTEDLKRFFGAAYDARIGLLLEGNHEKPSRPPVSGSGRRQR
jgi:hypothetical protein